MPLNKPNWCYQSGCPLAKLGRGFSQPEGQGTLGVLIIGEALGVSEYIDGLPFRPYAQSGAVLERVIKKAGFDRQQFVLSNIVKCQPPNNKLEYMWYEKQACSACCRYTDSIITNYRPRVILALGNVALKHLTGLIGKARTVTHLRGFNFPSLSYNGIPVIPSYHPSYLARGKKNLTGVMIHDLKRAVEIAQQGVPKDIETHYVGFPTVKEAQNYLRLLEKYPAEKISYDIETDYSTKELDESDVVGSGKNITEIQFAHTPGEAMVFPWSGEYISIAKKILALENDKWGWNTIIFDNPILESHDAKINGKIYDLMWAWHHLQPDLPKGLQYVSSFYCPEIEAWKHLVDSDRQLYCAKDVDSLQRIGSKVFNDLKAKGIWRGYNEHVFKLYPVLGKISRRGLPVDVKAQQQFRIELQKSMDEKLIEIQRLHPDELKNLHPKNGYVNGPKDTAGLEQRSFRVMVPRQVVCLTCKGSGRIEGKRPGSSKYCNSCKKGSGQVTSKTEKVEIEVERWVEVTKFMPSSSPQLIKYLKHRNYPIPHSINEPDKETTGAKELEKLYNKTGDPLIGLIMDWRKMSKIASTYIDGWKPDDAGRVHTTYTTHPASGQLSSRNPNLQNIPKHGKLAEAFRKTIRAKDGYKIVSFDMTAFHALMTGFMARDLGFMRLARLGIHDYLTGHLLHLEGADKWLDLSDIELQGILSGVKKAHKDVREKKAKPTVHGYNFGLGARKLYKMYEENFLPTEEQIETFRPKDWARIQRKLEHEAPDAELEYKKYKERIGVNNAQVPLSVMNALFPKIKAYRDDILKMAPEYIITPHGYIRYFWDIKTWDKDKNDYRYGDDAEKAYAFGPSNNAHGELKDRILEIDREGYADQFNLINTIHDSLDFHCEDSLITSCLEIIPQILESPSKILIDQELAPNGLRCGIEASVGQNWASYNKETNPNGMQTVYVTPIERLS